MAAGPNSTSEAASARPPMGGVMLDIGLNALIPFLLYRFSKRYISPSEFTALLMATAFPMIKSIFDVVRQGRLDPVSVMVLLGIGASALALSFGGGPRILLIRESLFTGVFGLACFASLLLPRPMMFYFGRRFVAGDNERSRRGFEASWALPEVRFGHRLITIVWGSVYLGEFAIRLVLVYTVSAAIVLIVSPILLGGFTLLTLIWTFRYVHTLRERARPKVAEILDRDQT